MATLAGAPPGALRNPGASARETPETVGTKSMSISPKRRGIEGSGVVVDSGNEEDPFSSTPATNTDPDPPSTRAGKLEMQRIFGVLLGPGLLLGEERERERSSEWEEREGVGGERDIAGGEREKERQFLKILYFKNNIFNLIYFFILFKLIFIN